MSQSVILQSVTPELREHEVVAALRTLFPPTCAVAAKIFSETTEELPEVEALGVKGAVLRRKNEFAAGRHAARQVLADIGFPGAMIPAGADRAPIWPDGSLGSIAHADGVAVAVAATLDKISALGVDVERTAALGKDLWSQVMMSHEIDRLRRFPEPMQHFLATAVFSIKEAFFKLQFPQTHAWLDFLDAHVELDRPFSHWQLTTKVPITIRGIDRRSFSGTYWIGKSLTMAAAYEGNLEQC